VISQGVVGCPRRLCWARGLAFYTATEATIALTRTSSSRATEIAVRRRSLAASWPRARRAQRSLIAQPLMTPWDAKSSQDRAFSDPSAAAS
jgi:hypothetical protein